MKFSADVVIAGVEALVAGEFREDGDGVGVEGEV
jgi:hypothetical protein